jgi:CRISPR-associated protein Cas6
MYWNQDELPVAPPGSDAVVDCRFSIDCRQLPVDHAYALSTALVRICPWMTDEPGVGIHTVYVAGSQNGWERPAHETGNQILLSRRTRLTVRVPRGRVAELLVALPGTRILVDECPLTIGPGKTKPLSTETTLFARYLVTAPDQDEDAFLQAAAAALATIEIPIRKALCGKTNRLATPDGGVLTRSLMLAGLRRDESLRLQQQGLGPQRLMGCGIFIPHKGIDAVRTDG